MLGDDYEDPKTRKDKKPEEKEEEEKTTVEEVTDEQAAEIEKEKDEKQAYKSTEDMLESLKQKGKGNQIDLKDIDEAKDEVKPENKGTRKLLAGFKQANIKIYLLSEDLNRLYNKQRYLDLFDIGVFSIHSANHIEEGLNAIFRKGAMVHVETADYLTVVKKDEKGKFRDEITKKAEKAHWVPLANPPFKHHMFFQVDKSETDLSTKSTAAATEVIDDLMDLDKLALF